MARGRNVINQSIALEGGDEIIKLLKRMGAEGEAAARKLEQAFGRVEVRRGIQSQFDKLRTSFGDLQKAGSRVGKSFSEFSGSLKNVGGAFAATRDKVLLYTAALTGAAAGTALFVNNSLNRIDDLTDLAASLGVTVEELQGLKLAGNEAGVEANDFIKIIGSLSDTVDELNTKTAGADSAIEKLGTSFTKTEQNGVTIIRGIMATGEETKKAAKEMEKLSPKALALQRVLKQVGVKPGTKLLPIDVLKAVAKAFAGMEDGAIKTQMAIDIFGVKLGPKLIPFLNMGEKAIDRYSTTLEQMGVRLSGTEAQAGGTAADRITTLTGIFQQFTDKLVSQFAPDITNAADTIFASLTANGAETKKFIAETGKAIGTLIRDITRLATGDTANIQNKWIVDLYNWIGKASTLAKDLYNNVLVPGFKAVSDALEPVAKMINEAFGTKLTGTDMAIGAILFQLIGGFRLLASVIGLGTSSFKLLLDTFRLFGASGKVLVDLFGFFGKGLLSVGRLIPGFAALIGPQGLIAIAVIGLGALVYAFWDDIVAFTKQAFGFIVDAVSTGWEGVKTASSAIWEATRTLYADTWTGIKTIASDALTAIETVYSDSWTGLKTIATDARAGMIAATMDVWEGIKTAVSDAREGLYTVATETWGAIAQAANDLGALLAPVWQGIRDTAATAFQSVADLVLQAWSGASASVVESAQAIRDAILTATNVAGDVAGAGQIAAELVQPFRDAQGQITAITASFGALARNGLLQVSGAIAGAAAQIRAQIASIIAAIQQAIAAAARLRAAAASSRSSSSPTRNERTFASGGYVRGPGSPTSDSIPAWLSNGEFVIRAAAVRRYGLDFLRAINGMAAGISLKNGLPGFASGGLVAMPQLAMPGMSFGGSGPVSALTLVLGAESFSGLSGPADTIARLEKAMRARRMRSAGRPSPYASR
jgi:hypothetical protein